MDADIKNPQDALEWLDRSIREEAELDGEISNEHAIQLAFIQNMLAKFPRRNCDIGTKEEQSRRFDKVCPFRFTGNCAGCRNPLDDSAANGVSDCALFWAQMPYVEKEGGVV